MGIIKYNIRNGRRWKNGLGISVYGFWILRLNGFFRFRNRKITIKWRKLLFLILK